MASSPHDGEGVTNMSRIVTCDARLFRHPSRSLKFMYQLMMAGVHLFIGCEGVHARIGYWKGQEPAEPERFRINCLMAIMLISDAIDMLCCELGTAMIIHHALGMTLFAMVLGGDAFLWDGIFKSPEDIQFWAGDTIGAGACMSFFDAAYFTLTIFLGPEWQYISQPAKRVRYAMTMVDDGTSAISLAGTGLYIWYCYVTDPVRPPGRVAKVGAVFLVIHGIQNMSWAVQAAKKMLVPAKVKNETKHA